jgi:hypothetical protein
MKKLQGILSALLLLGLISVGTVPLAGAGNEYSNAHADRPHPSSKITRLSATQQGDAILLEWRAIEGCDGYRVYHQKGGELKSGAYSFDVSPSQTSYLFRDVTAGGHYSFRVCALYGRKEGPLSPRATVHMKDNTTAVRSDTAK